MNFGDAVLNVSIVDGWVSLLTYAGALIAFGFVAAKHLTLRWARFGALLFLGGAALGAGLVFLVNQLRVFGAPVEPGVWWWVPAVSGALAVTAANLVRARWWRRLLAVLAGIAILAAGAIGVNSAYGLNPTLGSLLGISTAQAVRLPPNVSKNASVSGDDPHRPLAAQWSPPSDMPTKGARGLIPGGIPNTVSNFAARTPEIYLPPAALTANPPKLPLMVMMMGQPGFPDVGPIADALDKLAAANHGLAPIVIVVDQLGAPTNDPLCLNSKRGQVEDYVMRDVLPWAFAHLAVRADAAHTTVAGYSNGGMCAAYFGAKYPAVFGNLVAISPEEFAGADNATRTLADVFGGNRAAYDAIKPRTIMERTGTYSDSFAVFTHGSADGTYGPGATRLAETAHDHGMATTLFVIPGAGHVGPALSGGLDRALAALFPRLGLLVGAG
ncbi:MAG TPA: alpha/beta hydrolase-fold protein [Candidatus Lumbricidophila sp.]|nr:alpha/beta hydrolase-fold protein [Candidatus Lumbricidophila sp.]